MSIYESLYDWQKKIVDRFSFKKNFGLFLKMGLGKTPLGLGFAETNNCDKAIIISINAKATEEVSVQGSWLWWAAKSSMNYRLFSKRSKDYDFDIDKHDLLLLNYESLFLRKRSDTSRRAKVELKPMITDFIKSCKGHNVAIIVDESHKIKNLQSIQTQAITKIKQQLRYTAAEVYTYLLTGTPFTNGYVDLYSQLKLLGYDETKGDFVERFCIRGSVPGLLGWQQPIVGYKNVEELFMTLHRYAITVETKDVVELPEQVFVDHALPMSKDFSIMCRDKALGKSIVDTLKRHNDFPLSDNVVASDWHLDEINARYLATQQANPFYRDIDFPRSTWLAESSGIAWLRARQMSIGFQGNSENSNWFDRRRLEQLKDFLSSTDDNYIIFYNFTPELIELYNICDELGYNIDVYCGEMKSLLFYDTYAEQSASDRLTNRKNVILANFASGSTGMNWQLYSSCIIFSMPLFKDYEQGLARIHRLGQKSTTVYHTFYQENWLDKSMKTALETKTQYSSNMFDSDLRRVQTIMSKEEEE